MSNPRRHASTMSAVFIVLTSVISYRATFPASSACDLFAVGIHNALFNKTCTYSKTASSLKPMLPSLLLYFSLLSSSSILPFLNSSVSLPRSSFRRHRLPFLHTCMSYLLIRLHSGMKGFQPLLSSVRPASSHVPSSPGIVRRLGFSSHRRC